MIILEPAILCNSCRRIFYFKLPFRDRASIGKILRANGWKGDGTKEEDICPDCVLEIEEHLRQQALQQAQQQEEQAQEAPPA